MELAQRRWVGRFVRLGLVAVAILIVARWMSNRTRSAVRSVARSSDVRIQTEAPNSAALGPGDAQIFSRDSGVNLVLQGDKVLAGLSPKTVARIRSEIATSGATDDTSGLGGSIAQFVKKTVSDKIGTHVVYLVAEIQDIRYEGGEIVLYNLKGEPTRMFHGMKVNKQPVSQSFDATDAQRFIELVKARKKSLP